MILENIKPNELKQSARILIIGNDLFYLKLIRYFLRKRGYKVQCFINLNRVLKYVDLTRFDLIISEVYFENTTIDP
jgi:PleD family two-component response regulator